MADDWYLDLSIEIVSQLDADEFELRASDVVTWLEASTVSPDDWWLSAATKRRR